MRRAQQRLCPAEKSEWATRLKSAGSYAELRKQFGATTPPQSSVCDWAAGKGLTYVGRPPLLKEADVKAALRALTEAGSVINAHTLETRMQVDGKVSAIGDHAASVYGFWLRRTGLRSGRVTTTHRAPDPEVLAKWRASVLEFIADCPFVVTRAPHCDFVDGDKTKA